MAFLFGRLHRLEQEQVIPIPLAKAWDFFSDPGNLSRITPPSMDFQVKGPVARPMFPGQIIAYRVKPLLGIPVTWVTEITHVEPGAAFVDEQRFGPYRLWHHRHGFKALPGNRTLVTDTVNFALPGGFGADLLLGPLIRKQVEGIFDYRRKVLTDMFIPVKTIPKRKPR